MPPAKSLLKQTEWIVNESIIFAGDDAVFDVTYHAPPRTTGTPAPRLLVVVGDNASGKSLFVRMLAARVGTTSKGDPIQGFTPVSLSIRERTGAGESEMGGIRKAMMFGDEQRNSTGATSATVVDRAFKNLPNYKSSLLVFDEPEIGLSQGYAGAMGSLIAQRCSDLPDSCHGIVVVSHSKPLIRSLIEHASGGHIFVQTGTSQPSTVDEWLAQNEVRSVEELLNLPEVGHQRFRAVHDLTK